MINVCTTVGLVDVFPRVCVWWQLQLIRFYTLKQLYLVVHILENLYVMKCINIFLHFMSAGFNICKENMIIGNIRRRGHETSFYSNKRNQPNQAASGDMMRTFKWRSCCCWLPSWAPFSAQTRYTLMKTMIPRERRNLIWMLVFCASACRTRWRGGEGWRGAEHRPSLYRSGTGHLRTHGPLWKTFFIFTVRTSIRSFCGSRWSDAYKSIFPSKSLWYFLIY